MKLYDNYSMITETSEDCFHDYYFTEDGQSGLGTAHWTEDKVLFGTFKGVTFQAKSAQEFARNIKEYFCKPVKIEIPKGFLNEILGSGVTLDIYDKASIRGKELVNISVKFGTDSQTLVTEWV